MIPDAAIVALRTSVSNQRSRKSTALIVMSWTWLCLVLRRGASGNGGRCGGAPTARADRATSGSGGVIERIGLTNRPISTIALPYSS